MRIHYQYKESSLRTRTLALVSVFAAIYAAGSLLPGFPMIGVPGSKIDTVRALEMSYGLILGPIFGPMAAFLGSIIGKTISGGGSGLFFTPLALVSTFAAACLGKKQVFGVIGWVLGSLPLAIFIIAWCVTDTGRSVWFVAIPHTVTLFIILFCRGRIAEWIGSNERMRLILGVLIVSLAGTMTGHLLGNLIFIMLFNPSPLLFVSILPVFIVERCVITAISTLVGTPLIMTVRRLYPELMNL